MSQNFYYELFPEKYNVYSKDSLDYTKKWDSIFYIIITFYSESNST